MWSGSSLAHVAFGLLDETVWKRSVRNIPYTSLPLRCTFGKSPMSRKDELVSKKVRTQYIQKREPAIYEDIHFIRHGVSNLEVDGIQQWKTTTFLSAKNRKSLIKTGRLASREKSPLSDCQNSASSAWIHGPDLPASSGGVMVLGMFSWHTLDPLTLIKSRFWMPQPI